MWILDGTLLYPRSCCVGTALGGREKNGSAPVAMRHDSYSSLASFIAAKCSREQAV